MAIDVDCGFSIVVFMILLLMVVSTAAVYVTSSTDNIDRVRDTAGLELTTDSSVVGFKFAIEEDIKRTVVMADSASESSVSVAMEKLLIFNFS